jgi:DNA-binding transcriptional ArsR family regulator
MIQVRMSLADLGRTRFAYSPLVEVVESLYLLSTRQMPVLHQRWLAEVRPRLDRVDMPLLASVVPARPFIADFFFRGTADRSTSIEQQLTIVATMPVDVLRADIESVWGDAGLPALVQDLVQEEQGPSRLADTLWEYWRVALQPYWPSVLAVLDDDVAHRAAELTKRGVEGLLAAMHPELTVSDDMLRIEKKRHAGHHEHHDLAGTGMLLVPSVFVWPSLVFSADPDGPPTLTYPARGIGNVWVGTDPSAADDGDALAALLGKSRATILRSLHIPRSTTELALSLRQSPPSVSQHLSVLRRSALVISWRSGRKVLYRRTDLGASVVEASGGAKAADTPPA